MGGGGLLRFFVIFFSFLCSQIAYNMDPDQTKVAVLLRGGGGGGGGGGGSKEQYSTFSEHAQVGNHECSNIVANILLADPHPLTLGQKKNTFFRTW